MDSSVHLSSRPIQALRSLEGLKVADLVVEHFLVVPRVKLNQCKNGGLAKASQISSMLGCIPASSSLCSFSPTPYIMKQHFPFVF